MTTGAADRAVHPTDAAWDARLRITAALGTGRGRADALALHAHEIGEGVRAAPPAWLETRPAATVASRSSGFLQAINGDALFDLAERHNLTIHIKPTVGEFVLPGEGVASVWPQAELDDEVVDAVRAALILGPERTLQADVAFGFQQLSDIAIKALSPGINDPTTAELCIDRLGELFVRLANRSEPDAVRSRRRPTLA